MDFDSCSDLLRITLARMALSPLWRGPNNIHRFLLDEQSYLSGWATAQTPSGTAVNVVAVIYA